MASPVDALLHSVRSQIAAGDIDSAFRELGEFVRYVNASPSRWGRVPASGELDSLCGELARAMRSMPLPAAAPPPDGAEHLPQVYVVSELRAGWGPSGWIRDLIACQPERHHVILVSDLHGSGGAGGAVQPDSGNVTVRAAGPGGSWLDRAMHLAAELQAFRHGRVFLAVDQEDAPAVAAAICAAPPRLHFCHHADYTLCLGMYLPGAVHIDLSPQAWHACRRLPGLSGNVYLPIVSPEVPPRPAGDFQWGAGEEEFTTAGGGSARKFEFPYDYCYADLIPERLARLPGRHVHLGPVSPGFLERLRSRCTALGVATERFVHVSHPGGLDAAIREHRAGLFIGSFPIGAARPVIEVMAGGTPVLGHANYASSHLSGQSLLYPEAKVWSTPDGFFEALEGFDPLTLWQHSQWARRHWERRHRPGILADLLAAPAMAPYAPPPPPEEAALNPLRRELETWDDGTGWEERRALETRIAALMRELDGARSELAAAREQCDLAAAELSRIRNSAAWRAVGWMFGGNAAEGVSPSGREG